MVDKPDESAALKYDACTEKQFFRQRFSVRLPTWNCKKLTGVYNIKLYPINNRLLWAGYHYHWVVKKKLLKKTTSSILLRDEQSVWKIPCGEKEI